eukprot:TRINITY_DN2014_c0_g1_i10.p1 TRINITY_DN2014_c0_g1~~TRINITY_DN2014_c0_g1_i10.p1  ORF type:complete len:173 (+),score=45.56 TRINITY_DN2014_c0_g1_i10:1310-1828(+)
MENLEPTPLIRNLNQNTKKRAEGKPDVTAESQSSSPFSQAKSTPASPLQNISWKSEDIPVIENKPITATPTGDTPVFKFLPVRELQSAPSSIYRRKVPTTVIPTSSGSAISGFNISDCRQLDNENLFVDNLSLSKTQGGFGLPFYECDIPEEPTQPDLVFQEFKSWFLAKVQ